MTNNIAPIYLTAGAEPSGRALYGRRVIWTLPCGSKMTVAIAGCATPEEASEKAWRMADESGWAPPRWWQWYRWDDTKRGGAERSS